MNNKCYGFITLTILTTFILCYKINHLNKKLLSSSILINKMSQKLEDVNDLNISCMHLGIAIDKV